MVMCVFLFFCFFLQNGCLGFHSSSLGTGAKIRRASGAVDYWVGEYSGSMKLDVSMNQKMNTKGHVTQRFTPKTTYLSQEKIPLSMEIIKRKDHYEVNVYTEDKSIYWTFPVSSKKMTSPSLAFTTSILFMGAQRNGTVMLDLVRNNITGCVSVKQEEVNRSYSGMLYIEVKPGGLYTFHVNKMLKL